MKRFLFFAMLFSAIGLMADTLFYGPETFIREASGPTQFSDTFTLCRTDGNFTLHVQNGDEDGDHKISSAQIWVNDDKIVQQSDFNQNVTTIEKPIPNVVEDNSLSIRLTSNPGGQITIWITGDVTCGLDLVITYPQDNDDLWTNQVILQGTITSEHAFNVTAQGGLPCQVEGVIPGEEQTFGFFCAIDLDAGPQNLAVHAQDTEGNEIDKSIDVSVHLPPDDLALEVSPDEGWTPLTVTFNLSKPLDLQDQSWQLDADGDGQWDATLADSKQSYSQEIVDTGWHFARAKFGWYEVQKAFLVTTPEDVQAQIARRWTTFLSALEANDLEAALSSIIEERREEYRNILLKFGDYLPALAAGMQTIRPREINPTRAEYEMIFEEEGMSVSYPVIFELGRNGSWIIDFF